ncbi:MAG TPA: S-layer homology domain-containing protein [Candidatus Flavonifractor merdigallinarum]|uniref:S-layer homology domain-containing protein n=1 Tax=Candidatus Flavonifractor merdigallinarum TaxID=2838589 RepID=A0A9D1Y8D6_9FIRM|nr:S-layer homology domain-containing protein [Candidatus Flavonifractor merdigallinarum]
MKKFLSLVMTGALALQLAAPALAADVHFADVADNAWYASAVAEATAQGMMSGIGNDKFNPTGIVTRGTVFQTLYNLAAPTDAVFSTSFVDVEGKWYANAAAWAEANGLAAVPADKTFAGDRSITRAEIASILYRYAQLTGVTVEEGGMAMKEAPDYDQIPAWALEGMSFCYYANVMKGDSKGNLNPNGTATRAELAQILVQFTALDTQDPGETSEETPAAEYIAAHEEDFFLTGKTEYTIQGMMVSKDTTFHNDLENVDYTATDDGESVVLKGTVGEQWVTKLSKVLETYTKADGSALTAEDFTSQKDTFIELKTKAESDTNFACFVPADVRLSVNTAWGDVLHVNDPAAEHGYGDYLVCPNVDGKPDFSDVWVVNGAIFGSTYDVSRGPVVGSVAAVEKYGNLDLDIKPEALYTAGLELGDVLDVTVNGVSLEIPFCTAYSDVNTGETVVRDNQESDLLVVAINMGDFAGTYGVEVGDIVSFTLAEKAGYLGQYQAHQLQRTNERADYSSDEVFANFRPITVGKIAEGVLYRTSSPVNPELGRASYADDLIEKAGVQTVLNLADDAETLESYFTAEGFDSPYYQSLYEKGGVIALNMGVDYKAEDFQTKLKSGLEFMIAHEGPYAFHCTEGKDRAGFTAILLEALMGATQEEIVADYMVSYENYYHVEKGSEQYQLISEVAVGMLRDIAGLEKGADLTGVDLQKAAVDYLTGIGMTEQQVSDLQSRLSTPVAK